MARRKQERKPIVPISPKKIEVIEKGAFRERDGRQIIVDVVRMDYGDFVHTVSEIPVDYRRKRKEL